MRMKVPQDFECRARKWLGEERYGCLEAAFQEEPSVSVRLNPAKVKGLDLPAGGEVPWAAAEGRYLKDRPMFTADPWFHAGAYYVQEASSMSLGMAVRRYVDSPVVALDLCAAPGGKSTHLRALLPEGSLLVSNEPVRARAQVLAENMTKWGHPDVVVTQSYPADFSRLTGFFDVVVADVPCSGEGMFRKEADAVAGWSMDCVAMCRDRQRDILRAVWPALRPGGLLMYSTCTFNPYENEENVDWIARELGAELLPLAVDEAWHVCGDLRGDAGCAGPLLPVCHFLPGLVRGEGFFLSVLRKTSTNAGDCGAESAVGMPARLRKREKGKSGEGGGADPAFRTWLRHPLAFDFRDCGPRVVAFRAAWSRRLDLLCRAAKVIHAGIPLAERKGKDWMPLHALALSAEVAPSAFPVAEVDYDTAVAYLRKEALVLPPAVPKGYVLVAYGGLPLGFVKNVGGRANNLYPAEWKIRTGHLVPYSLRDSSFL